MKSITSPAESPIVPILVRGLHLKLTPALRESAQDKVARLIGRDSRIERIRIELELEKFRQGRNRFVAKGRLEVSGPDLMARAVNEDAYKALDLLVDKLDELLRRRHQKRVNTRNDRRRKVPAMLHGLK